MTEFEVRRRGEKGMEKEKRKDPLLNNQDQIISLSRFSNLNPGR